MRETLAARIARLPTPRAHLTAAACAARRPVRAVGAPPTRGLLAGPAACKVLPEVKPTLAGAADDALRRWVEVAAWGALAVVRGAPARRADAITAALGDEASRARREGQTGHKTAARSR